MNWFAFAVLLIVIIIIVYLVIVAIYFYKTISLRPPTPSEGRALFWVTIVLIFLMLLIGFYAMWKLANVYHKSRESMDTFKQLFGEQKENCETVCTTTRPAQFISPAPAPKSTVTMGTGGAANVLTSTSTTLCDVSPEAQQAMAGKLVEVTKLP